MDDRNHTTPRHPGRILLERLMQPLGISRNQLARDIDVPVGRISDITNAKRGITADTALRLGRYFGIAPQLWMRLQAEYDLHVARMTAWRDVEPRVRVLGARNTPEPQLAEPAAAHPAEDRPLLPDVPLPEPASSDDAGPGEEELGIPPRPDDWRS